MAYCTADTGNKVGFRPYRQTDPYGAAHLSGIPDSHLSGEVFPTHLGDYRFGRPFDPWILYTEHDTGLSGLGQLNPFKPTAWHLHGLGYLGDAASDSAATGMINEGYDPNVVYPLVTAGATAGQLQDLWDHFGANTPEFASAASALMTYLQSGIPNIPTPLPPALAHSSSSSSPSLATATSQPAHSPSPNVASIPQPAGVPAGTEMLYQVTWAAQALTTKTPQDLEAAVAAALATKWGIQVVSSSATANFFINQPTFSIYVVTGVDYGQLNDVKSILDGEVYNAGRKVASSSISIVKSGTGQVNPPSLSLQWLENNAIWLGLGLGALIFLPNLMGGRRR